MQNVFKTFEERTEEIDICLKAIQELEERASNCSEDMSFYGATFSKILKANVLLMIYNLVESTVMGGILQIYDKLQREGLTYKKARKEIREIWFSCRFMQAYDPKAHYNSYKKKAHEIIDSILVDEVLKLDRKATSISGNLDADKIRKLLHIHGIEYAIDAKIDRNNYLSMIKERRNSLAHGTVSFAECGRNYSINDLRDMKKDTVLFLSEVLKGMNKYYTERLYAEKAGADKT